jgi:hypothetical protein
MTVGGIGLSRPATAARRGASSMTDVNHHAAQHWAGYPEAISLARCELPSYCLRQRWYPAKDAGIPVFSLEVLIPFPEPDGDSALAIWNVTVEGGEPFAMFIPSAIVSQDEQENAHLAAIGQVAAGRWVTDALGSDSFVKGLVQLMLQDRDLNHPRCKLAIRIKLICCAQSGYRSGTSSATPPNPAARSRKGSPFKARRRGRRRGEPSAQLPPTAFVAFTQNHDQIGNRAFGDRINQTATWPALRAVAAAYLLLPQIPMLFMGEEWGSKQPFPFVCDFPGTLGEAVRKGRREEFAKFPEFQDEANREKIPDPQSDSTFLAAKLRWDERDHPEHAAWVNFYRRILAVRRATSCRS